VPFLSFVAACAGAGFPAEAASEASVPPAFAGSDEAGASGEEVTDAVLSAFFSALLAFLGSFLEKPTGTSRSMSSNSARVRMISRTMNLNLHE
jgi:hypothetical protein